VNTAAAADTAVDTAVAGVEDTAADMAAADTAVEVAEDTAELRLVLAQDTVEAKVAIQLSRKQCEIFESTLYGYITEIISTEYRSNIYTK
jgi:hypothetical protein